MTTTIRIKAKEQVADSVLLAAEHSHVQNYHRLHIRRDGAVTWFESINKSDDLIDDQATGFASIPSVGVYGTGEGACNCDHCEAVYCEDAERLARERGENYDKGSKYDTAQDAIYNAVENSDLSDLEADMMRSFDAIEMGYFDDE